MTAPDTAAIRARSQRPGYQEGQALQDVLALCDAQDSLCNALDEARAENERLRGLLADLHQRITSVLEEEGDRPVGKT